MTNYRKLFRLLFALQVAFLPLIVFGQIMFATWMPLMFFCSIFVFRLWCEAFITRASKQDFFVICINDILVVTFACIFLAVTSRLGIVYAILIGLVNCGFQTVQMLQFGKPRTDIAMSLDFSFRFFVYLALVFAFIPASIDFWVKVLSLSAIIVGLVDLVYKLVFYIRGKRKSK